MDTFNYNTQSINGIITTRNARNVCATTNPNSDNGSSITTAPIKKGLKLTFNTSSNINGDVYPDFDTTQINTGFETTVQNCLIDTLTNQGSDTIFPTRGTTLQEDAYAGFITNSMALQHSCNFAAEIVKQFQNNVLKQETDTITSLDAGTVSENDDGVTSSLTTDNIGVPTIETYKLQLNSKVLDKANLEAYFVSSEGETVGLSLDTNLIS